MPDTMSSTRPWGERTPRQRLVTYSLFAIAGLVATVVWFSGVFELRGLAPLGYVILPVTSAILAWRSYQAWNEVREGREESAEPPPR
jgi:hypothetical protein